MPEANAAFRNMDLPSASERQPRAMTVVWTIGNPLDSRDQQLEKRFLVPGIGFLLGSL